MIQRWTRNERFTVVAVPLLVVLFFLRAPLSESFWLDETISVWIVSGSLQDVITRTISFQGQSPFYYLLLWMVRTCIGNSEFVLRGLSCLFSFVTIAVIYRLTLRMCEQRSVALLSVVALLCADQFQLALLNARPYALAICLASISVSALYELRESFSHRKALIFSGAVVGAWYAHYLFGVIALVHAFHVLRDRQLTRRMVPWMVAGGIASLPGSVQWFSLYQRAEGLSFAPRPNLSSILHGAMPVVVVLAVLIGIFVACTSGSLLEANVKTKRAIRFLAPYVITPIVIFLGIGLFTRASLWVPRYWGWQEPIWVMVLMLVMSILSFGRGRTIAFAIVLLYFTLKITTEVYVLEDWRSAASILQREQGGVVLYSTLIEVETGSGTDQPEFDEYVRAPLTVYGVDRPIYVVALDGDMNQSLGALRQSTNLVARKMSSPTRRSPTAFVEIARQNGIKVIPLQHRKEKSGELVTVWGLETKKE